MAMTEALDVLVGSWDLTGRTLGAEQDDISGTLTVTSILGGGVLHLDGVIRMGDTQTHALELVWRDAAGVGYRSHVYSGTGAPVDYRWERDGATLLHAGSGMTYTGMISADGATIAGIWRADADRPDLLAAEYHATMRRRPVTGPARRPD